jgi:ATP-dependent RNA helicase DeaD
VIKITPKQLTVDAIEQAYVEVGSREKTDRLKDVLRAEEPEQAIIFCRTKIGCSRLDKQLRDSGWRCKALHGDLSQGQRDGVMIQFKEHKLPFLVATDVAARGLDIEHVTHVINYDLPNNAEIYVHRIGRTGRVGRTGRAITFVTPAQMEDIQQFERELKTSIGEWEAPEERLKHAPRPRRRDHSKERKPEREKLEVTEEHVADEVQEKPDSSNGAKLFVNRGHGSGIEQDDLHWALTEGAVIPEDDITRIEVLDRFSFVELSEDQAALALERLDGTKLKGKQIRVEYAKS